MRAINRIFIVGIILLAIVNANAFAAVTVELSSTAETLSLTQSCVVTVVMKGSDTVASMSLYVAIPTGKVDVTAATSPLGATLASVDNIKTDGRTVISFAALDGFKPAAEGTQLAVITCTAKEIGDAVFSIEADSLKSVVDPDLKPVTATSPSSLTINIVANNNPVATTGTLDVDEDTPKDGTMAATDADGDALTFAVTTPPTKGDLKINDATKGAFTYTPKKDENGVDVFTFEATDGKGGKGGAVFNITITAKNDAPVADDLPVTIVEDNPAKGNVTATDADKDPIVYSIAAQATSGVATVNADGSFTYVPNLNFNGTDSFSFTAADPNGGKGTGKVSVTVTADNDKPVAEAGKATWVLSDPKTFTGTLVGKDIDNDVLTFKIVNPPTQGTLTVDAKGVYTFKPNADAKPGPDTFTFLVNDGKIDSDAATIEVAIESGAHTLTLNIVPTAGGKVKAGGNMIPDGGKVVVEDGKAQDFTTTANEGYFALSARVVWADGTKTFTKIADNKFTVKDVKQDGVLTVTFKAQYKITISATPAKGGVCDPVGPEKLVNGGDDQIITVTANKGFMIEEVKIDGVAVDVTDDLKFVYTFVKVDKAHTVDVVFMSTGEYHSGDANMDYAVSMPELLRVIQLFNTNMGNYICDGTTEDGYASGDDATKRTCLPHDADFEPIVKGISVPDWNISLGELLRVIQFWSLGGYHKPTNPADAGSDGFAPGPK